MKITTLLLLVSALLPSVVSAAEISCTAAACNDGTSCSASGPHSATCTCGPNSKGPAICTSSLVASGGPKIRFDAGLTFLRFLDEAIALKIVPRQSGDAIRAEVLEALLRLPAIDTSDVP
jgi:hypothetical protein